MLSVVIPTLDEEDYLPACLEVLAPQARRVGAEVIVVDGGSRDRTRDVGDQAGVHVLESPPGRGRQMNRGADAASGSLLVFVPADTRLPPDALEVLTAIDRAGRPAAGGMRQRFDQPRRFLRAISWMHNLRVGLTGIVYGDQIPFIRRELFFELGGYREDGNLEDIEFGVRLKRRVHPRLLPLTAVTSARRFDRHGDLKATVDAALILAAWTFRRRIRPSDTFFQPVR